MPISLKGVVSELLRRFKDQNLAQTLLRMLSLPLVLVSHKIQDNDRNMRIQLQL